MRTFIAALLGATAVLPALVHAMPTGPDPADVAALVPTASVPSVFTDYRPYREQKAPTWQALNRAVESASGEPGMDHGQMHSGDEANGGSAQDSDHGSNQGANQGSNHSSKRGEHGAHHEEPAK